MRSIPPPVQALSDALTRLGEIEPAVYPAEQLAAELTELHRQAHRLAAQITRRVAVFHARGDAAIDGAQSTQSWLSHRLRLSRPRAAQEVAVASALPSLPAAAAAYEAGELSFAHVAVLAHGIRRVGSDTMTSAQPLLLEAAAVLDPGRLRRMVTHLQYAIDPDGAEADPEAAYERRGLWCSPTPNGMVAVDGLLDPDTGAALLEVVHSGPPPSPDDRRDPAARRADRLGEVLRAFLATGEPPASGGLPTQVTLSADLATLQGKAGQAAPELDWIGPTDLTTARLIGCDCQVTGVVVDRDGSPLNVGWRRRTATPAQRTALVLRDKHCQAPGCDRPARWCDAHHVVGWYYGGRTDLDNLVLLCRRHHRAVHARIWRIEKLGGGRFRFVFVADRVRDRGDPESERRPRAG